MPIEADFPSNHLAPVEQLPQDMLHEIFSFLIEISSLLKVRAVCKKWNEVIDKIYGERLLSLSIVFQLKPFISATDCPVLFKNITIQTDAEEILIKIFYIQKKHIERFKGGNQFLIRSAGKHSVDLNKISLSSQADYRSFFKEGHQWVKKKQLEQKILSCVDNFARFFENFDGIANHHQYYNFRYPH